MEPSVWNYPIMIGHKWEEDDAYYMVWLPDFGITACSATGETVEEALENLQGVYAAVDKHYRKTGKEVPRPTWPVAFHM